MDTVEDGEGGTNWESSMDMYTPPRVNRWEAVYTTGSPALHSAMTWKGGRETQEGGNIYIVTAELNTTLWSNYPPITKNKTKALSSSPRKKRKKQALKSSCTGSQGLPLLLPTPHPHTLLPLPFLGTVDSGTSIRNQVLLADPGEKPWGLSSSLLWGMHQLVWLVWHHNFPSLRSSGWGCVYGNRPHCSCQLRQDLSPLLATSSPTPTARYSWKLLESACAGAT